MKRQRDSCTTERKRSDADLDCQVGNDCYDEIIQQTDGGNTIRSSWFKARTQIHKNEIDRETTSSESSPFDAIKSLSQQLIQVKRKLWPAAEKCAAAWDSTPGPEFWTARAFANPMEALGECKHGGLNQMFINRSAIKLANIDAVLDFRLSNPPVTDKGGSKNHFLFADLCGAPGGFSEYIMKRIRSKGASCACRGYGMSLVGKNEHGKGAIWRLEDFCESDATFSIDYKVHYGADGTGDIYNWENVKRFQEDIQLDLQEAMIPRQKMNLVVADGGFDAQRDSECQEEVAQKLILCELATALDLIDFGGTLVIKLFGCRTESIRMAMRSMYDLFDSMEMIKPVSSRPASSERYAVLTSFKGLPQSWEGGQSWINDVMIGKCLEEDINFYSRVDGYLDQFDQDMLLLNLKACFAILSHLERKTIATESSRKRWEIQFKAERERINIKMYKHGWQLFI
jgi:cap1 methyltransferase